MTNAVTAAACPMCFIVIFPSPFEDQNKILPRESIPVREHDFMKTELDVNLG